MSFLLSSPGVTPLPSEEGGHRPQAGASVSHATGLTHVWPATRSPLAGVPVSRPGVLGPSPRGRRALLQSPAARRGGSRPAPPSPGASPLEALCSWQPRPGTRLLFSRVQTASAGADGSPLRRAGWRGMAATALLEAGLARVLFYPTLLYTLFRGKVPGRAHRDWYHRIDPTVLLGALPLRSLTRQVSQAGKPGHLPRPRRSVSVGPLGSPPSLLSHLFASAAGTGRERARGDHHERRV